MTTSAALLPGFAEGLHPDSGNDMPLVLRSLTTKPGIRGRITNPLENCKGLDLHGLLEVYA